MRELGHCDPGVLLRGSNLCGYRANHLRNTSPAGASAYARTIASASASDPDVRDGTGTIASDAEAPPNDHSSLNNVCVSVGREGWLSITLKKNEALDSNAPRHREK